MTLALTLSVAFLCPRSNDGPTIYLLSPPALGAEAPGMLCRNMQQGVKARHVNRCHIGVHLHILTGEGLVGVDGCKVPAHGCAVAVIRGSALRGDRHPRGGE